MEWLYLFTGAFMSAISLYHLFTHRHRKSSQDYIIYQLNDDRKKVTTESKVYKQSIFTAYIVLLLTLVLIVEVFSNSAYAGFLAAAVFILGGYVLVTLDRVFEIQGEAIIFAGYHAKWGKIRSVQWGKQKKHRRQLIMELGKGQKIKTTIANNETEELEDVLSNYVHFEKE